MKKTITILIPALLFVFSMSLMYDAELVVEPVENFPELAKLDIPENVNGILEKSCIGCHNTESKNTKGKTKLNFDKFTNEGYSKGKLIGKLNGIVKSMKKGSMPPEKFLKKYPDRGISAEDAKLLSQWASDEANKLMSE